VNRNSISVTFCYLLARLCVVFVVVCLQS